MGTAIYTGNDSTMVFKGWITVYGKERVSRSRNLRESWESFSERTKTLRCEESILLAKGHKNQDTNRKTRQILATLIPFGSSPAYIEEGSGKESKTSWKV